ncbi:MAG: DUF1801 domain-containing protein [Bacteroidetes bacterium]|nr:DUF1801 domain-containing protein [Bacteroidota bacterium]
MIHKAESSSEYIEVLEDDWRKEKLLLIREIIRAKAPKIKEGMEYKMLSFGDGHRNIFHLNAQKNYVSLYVGNASKVDPDGILLEGLDVGKGCIRFKKSVDISDTQIDRFIEKALSMWENKEDIGC